MEEILNNLQKIFEKIFGSMPGCNPESMPEGFSAEKFLVESVDTILEELLIKYLIEYQEEFLVASYTRDGFLQKLKSRISRGNH